MASNTRLQLENWLKTVEVKGSVLDVGGAQHNIKGRTKSWEVNDYKVLDLDIPHQGEKPDLIGDIQIIGWGVAEPTGGVGKIIEFDNVFCIEVSEYWHRPLEALKNINILLKRGGLLYVSFHFIYPEHLPKGMDMLRYTPSGVVKLLEEAGFEILENIPRKSKVDFTDAWNIEGMRGWKNFDPNIIGNLIKARKK